MRPRVVLFSGVRDINGDTVDARSHRCDSALTGLVGIRSVCGALHSDQHHPNTELLLSNRFLLRRLRDEKSYKK